MAYENQLQLNHRRYNKEVHRRATLSKTTRTEKMESVQDRFNVKIISLEKLKHNIVNLYEEFEKERRATLSEAKEIERSAKDNFNQDLVETCRVTKVILEDLKVDILPNVETENPEEHSFTRNGGQVNFRSLKKCRYYNRGFCKYEGKCKFYHPEIVCEEYLQDGLCRQRKCEKRHPRHCRFWTTKPEGCRRGETCRYLHAMGPRFCPEERQNRRRVSVVLSCDMCQDGCENETCNEDHVRKDIDMERIINKYDYMDGTEKAIDQEEIDLICQRYEGL